MNLYQFTYPSIYLSNIKINFKNPSAHHFAKLKNIANTLVTHSALL